MSADSVVNLPGFPETSHKPQNPKVHLQKVLFTDAPDNNGGTEKLQFKICNGDYDNHVVGHTCCQSRDFYGLNTGRAIQHWFHNKCKGFEITWPKLPSIQTSFRTNAAKKKWNLRCIEFLMTDNVTRIVCTGIQIMPPGGYIGKEKCDWVQSKSSVCTALYPNL